MILVDVDTWVEMQCHAFLRGLLVFFFLLKNYRRRQESLMGTKVIEENGNQYEDMNNEGIQKLEGKQKSLRKIGIIDGKVKPCVIRSKARNEPKESGLSRWSRNISTRYNNRTEYIIAQKEQKASISDLPHEESQLSSHSKDYLLTSP